MWTRIHRTLRFYTQTFIKMMKTHPHRAALHADLQQNNVYNPFSKNSNAMIRELGNVELFELCETFPKVQMFSLSSPLESRDCLLHLRMMLDVHQIQKEIFNRQRLDALSIPDYVIKKGAIGARHGKTEIQREYHLAWNAWKRCCKKVDSQGEHFTGVHDLFLRDPVYRGTQLATGWTEQIAKSGI